jgi:predicted Zn-dependent peptidase
MKFNPTLHKLSNGITVILDPMDLETVSMQITIRGGSRIEQPHEFGISHFIEHMLFDGSKRYPSSKIAREFLNDNGGTRGGSTNVSYTTYDGRILADNFDALIDVLCDMIVNPLFDKAEFEKERNVIIQEIHRSRDNDGRQFNDVVKRNLFVGSYLEKYDNMGSAETLGAMTTADLINYKNKHYTANNIIIGISGKINDAAHVLEMLEKLLGAIPVGDDIVIHHSDVKPSVVYDVRNDKKQTRLAVLTEYIYGWERKYDYERMCTGVFENALGRRLFDNIRDKRGLVYSFGFTGYGDMYTDVCGFATALSPEKLSECIAAMANECYDILHRNPVTIEELNRKNTMTKLSRADFMESAGRRSDKLVGFYAAHGELYDPAEFDKMRGKMTIDDVMKYSADYFKNPISIIAMGPVCDIDLKQIWDENFK